MIYNEKMNVLQCLKSTSFLDDPVPSRVKISTSEEKRKWLFDEISKVLDM